MKSALWLNMCLTIAVMFGAGCEVSERDPRAADVDSDTDADTDSDADSDTDSDADNDTDVDSDGDGGTGDAGVLEMDCSACEGVGGSMANMLCAIDLCDEEVVVENTLSVLTGTVECIAEDMYEAVEQFGADTNGLDPKKNGSYALMATGPATGTSHTTGCDGSTASGLTDPWSSGEQIRDVVEWRITLTAPENAEAFHFKYVFFSQEYDDFISSGYNDKFYAVLEAASTNGGDPTVINYTDCRDPGAYTDFDASEGCDLDSGFCCYIAINSAFSECCWYPNGSIYAPNGSDPACPGGYATTDISGTGFECAEDVDSDGASNGSSTGWLQTAWPIIGGETFSLTFHIHDTSDSYLDSEVLLDGFEFLGVVEQGTGPIIE